ncbi:PQQ-dependent catabolism-associated beta-propeller protein [Calidithermus terrae]|uniref:PQQ-dependent catabolism-associated beta-propeller protein n=1 Tax=Calidithermus terrae TaxID=1408545 RepID=A0A399EB35_9DEIN|nr:PQQ-dependent catabolism-associated beta-propeller protein [Calidithermus terrae]
MRRPWIASLRASPAPHPILGATVPTPTSRSSPPGGSSLARGVLGLLALALAACTAAPPNAPHWVWVSQAGSRSVAVVDPSEGRVVKRITVGMLPHRLLLAPDGRTVYAVLVGSQAVAEIDVPGLALRRTFLTAPVPERRDDGSVIAAHQEQNASGHTTCFDCHGGGPAKPAIVGTRPFGVALSADGARLVVSQIRAGSLAVLERSSGALERTVPLPPAGEAHEAVDVARLGDSFYVTLRPTQPATTPSVLRRLEAQTLQARSEEPTGSDPAMLLPDPERGRMLVSNFETNTLTAFGATGGRSTYTVSPGPLGMLLLPQGRLLSLGYYSNSVSLVGLDSGKVESLDLELGGERYVNPTHAALAPDRRHVYIVSSGTKGHLLVFDLAEKRVTRAIPIDGLSFDVVVVPKP